MRAERTRETRSRDFALERGCILCGGDLQVRASPEGHATVCLSCRWISRPRLDPQPDGLHVVHPAGLVG